MIIVESLTNRKGDLIALRPAEKFLAQLGQKRLKIAFALIQVEKSLERFNLPDVLCTSKGRGKNDIYMGRYPPGYDAFHPEI